MKPPNFVFLNFTLIFMFASNVNADKLDSFGPDIVVEFGTTLSLTTGQLQVIGELVDGSSRGAIHIRAKIEIIKLNLRKEMRKEHPRQDQVASFVDAIGAKEAALRKSRLLTWIGVRELLTTGQREKLSQELRKLRAQKQISRVQKSDSGIPATKKPIRSLLKPGMSPANVKPTPISPWTGKGELEIRSPNVFGEVWVNKRRIGYPPVIVKNLITGRHLVEIRVGGKVRRSQRAVIIDERRSKIVLLDNGKARHYGP